MEKNIKIEYAIYVWFIYYVLEVSIYNFFSHVSIDKFKKIQAHIVHDFSLKTENR
jgi:hypothetical protein